MPTIVQTVTGRVTGLWGTMAQIREAGGSMRDLKIGDIVNRGDVLLTSQDGIVQLSPEPTLPAAGELPDPITPLPPLPQEPPEVILGGGDGGDLQPGLRVDRVVENVTPASLNTAPPEAAPVPPPTAGILQTQNLSPLADPNSLTVREDTQLPIVLTGRDPDGAVTSFTVTTVPANGTLTLANGTPVTAGQVLTPAQAGNLLFTPAPNFNGNTGIVFTVTDNEGAVSTPATVSIAVTPDNNPPAATPGALTVAEDTRLPVSLGGTDPDGTVTAVTVTGLPTNGTLTLANGTPVTTGEVLTPAQASTLVFTPAPDFNGNTGITFTVTDNGGLISPPAVVSITVTPVNDPPVPVVTPASGPEDTPIIVKLGGTDVDGTVVTVTVTQLPANGTLFHSNGSTPVAVGEPLAPAEAGQLVFLPAPDFNGNTTIVFTVADNGGLVSPPATVPVTVTPVVDPVIAVNDVSINEAAGFATFTVTLSEPTTATVSVAFNTSNGTAVAGQDYTAVAGTLTFAPGVTSQTITVPIANDNVFEGPETFNVNLSAPTNATIGDGLGIGTIRDDGSVPGPGPIPADDDTPRVGTVSSPTVVEGGNLDFSITLTHPSTTPTTVALTPASGSATLGTDTSAPILVSFDGGASFVPVAGSNVSVPAGSTGFIVRIPTVDDPIVESTETLTLGAATPANTAPVIGTGTILDNDGTPALAISGPAVINESVGTVTYTVTLSSPSSQPVTVRYGTVDGTATAGQDYTATNGTLTFAAGETTKTITVAITNDNVFEGPETFSVKLDTPTRATISTDTVVSTIRDDGTDPGPNPDDDTPHVGSVSSPTVIEGGNLDFTVTLTHPSTTPTTVTLSPASGSATLGVDTSTPILVSFDGGTSFTAVTGSSVSVPPGSSGFIVRIPTVDDPQTEPTETLTLGAATPADTVPVVGTGTIVDNDGTPSFVLTGPAVIDEAAGTVTYTVTLSNPSALPVSVNYGTVNGTATAGQDYTAASGTLNFAPNELTKTITVAITNDNVFEGPETFSVVLTNPAGAAIAVGTVQSTIVDDGTGTPPGGGTPDNDTPKLSIVGPAVIDESAGTVTYTVTLSNPSTKPVTVSYGTADGTATAGQDYTAANGTLTFAPNELTKTITVAIANDNLFEGPETFSVNLSAPTGATIAVPTVTSTIVDDGTGTPPGGGTPDNDTPKLSIVGPAVIDESAGTVTYTVSLSNPSTKPVTVSYGTADGTATAGQDYTAATGTLTFAPNELTKTITVAIANDNLFEGPETFSVNLSAPTGATIAVPTVVSTIVDDGTGPGPNPDNDTPKLSINGPAVIDEAAGTATYTVTLSNPSTKAVTVAYGTVDGTAVAGQDYTAATGTLTFAPNELTKTITVAITNDNIFEGAETFSVKLTTPTGATILKDTVVSTIVDDGTGPGPNPDNDTPKISINGPVLIDEASGTATYTVTLSNPSTKAVTVAYGTVDGTAVAGQDYTAATGTLTFAPNELTKTITVAITNDNIFEGAETFSVKLTTPTGATILKDTVVSTIVDDGTGPGPNPDNDTPKISINGPVLIDEASGTATYTVTLSNPSTKAVTVAYGTVDGTAVAGQDYTAATGTLTFAPNELTKTITVAITNDNIFEGAETFSVKLTTPTGATILKDTVVSTIVDDGTGPGPNPDNDTPKISINGPVLIDEASGTATYTVTLSNPSTKAVTVAYGTVDGTAVAGQDYTAATGTLTFAPNELTKTITVAITNDNIFEGAETFSVKLTTPTGATILKDTVVSTIVDDGTGPGPNPDNDTPKLSINGPAVIDEAAGTATYTVTLSNPSTKAVTVAYGTVDGTAVAGQDYTAATGTLTFAPNELTKTITIAITNDNIFEGAETFSVRLTTPTGATILKDTVVSTIVDDGTGPGPNPDNDTPKLSINGPAVIDEAAGTATYTVTLSNPSTKAVTVAYSTVDGTAVAGQDYTAATGTLTFAPNELTKTITVAITNDNIFEGAETFSVKLTTPTGATILKDTVVSTIVDDGTGPGPNPDNDTPKLSINGPAVINEAAGTATYTVTLSNPSTKAVTVAYGTVDGTAVAGQDYTAATGTLTFAPNELTKTITVAITNDNIYEGAENFSVRLTTPTGATILKDSVVTTIDDSGDEPKVTAVSDARAIEGNNLDFAVTLSNVSTLPTALTFKLTGGSATLGTDTGTLQVLVGGVAVSVTTNADGSFSALIPANTPIGAVTVRVPSIDDGALENTEAFTLSASTVFNTAPLTGTGKILDNDATPDAQTIAEDTVATGNVLTNDHVAGNADVLALTSFVVAGNSYTAGATAVIANVGSLRIDGSGAYTFTPVANYSGAVPQVTYSGTKTDPAEGVAVPITSTLNITVTPVADAPVLTQTPKVYAVASNFEDVVLPASGYTTVQATALGSTPGVWKTDNIGGGNGTPGSVEVGLSSVYGVTQPYGANNHVLELEQDPLDRGNLYTVVSNAEAGEVYSLSFDYAPRQNSGAVTNSVVFVYWENQLVQVLDSTNAPMQTYTLNLLATGPGSKLEFIAQDSNSYGGILDNLALSLLQSTGYEGTRVNLPALSAALVDSDGSERLSTLISAIPVGATLTDGVHTFTAGAGSQSVDVSTWTLADIDLLTPRGLTGTVTLDVTSTSTEIANGSSASTSAKVNLTILADPNHLIGNDSSESLTGTAGDDRMWGLSGDDVINGGNGNNVLLGGAGNDRLTGGTGNDALDGGTGNDILIGGAGRDVLSGGVGNDTLTGGTGAAGLDPTTDVFRWHLGDGGTKGAPAADVITDFNPNAASAGGDILDLRDLLQGENAAITTANAPAALRNYIDFDTTSSPGSTVIHVSTTGGFTNGTYSAGAEDQRITLNNVDLRASFNLGTGGTDDQIIQTLLNRGKLIVDGGP